MNITQCYPKWRRSTRHNIHSCFHPVPAVTSCLWIWSFRDLEWPWRGYLSTMTAEAVADTWPVYSCH